MPSKQPHRKSHVNNVVQLELTRAAPHPERLEAMRQWHQEKAFHDDQDLAAVHISITADGSIKTEGICMEPVHAQAMLAAIPKLIERLQSAAGIQPRPRNIQQLIGRGHRSFPPPSNRWGSNTTGMSMLLDSMLANHDRQATF